MKTKSADLEIRDLDCPNIQVDLGVEATSSDLEDEILREILEEERLRNEELDKKKKTTKKKKKDSKKSKDKEDL